MPLHLPLRLVVPRSREWGTGARGSGLWRLTESLWGSAVYPIPFLCPPPLCFSSMVSTSYPGAEFLSPLLPWVLDGMTELLGCCLRMFLLPTGSELTGVPSSDLLLDSFFT